jgi:hypothetical protein
VGISPDSREGRRGLDELGPNSGRRDEEQLFPIQTSAFAQRCWLYTYSVYLIPGSFGFFSSAESFFQAE